MGNVSFVSAAAEGSGGVLSSIAALRFHAALQSKLTALMLTLLAGAPGVGLGPFPAAPQSPGTPRALTPVPGLFLL